MQSLLFKTDFVDALVNCVKVVRRTCRLGDTFKNPYDIVGIPHASDIELVKNTWKE